MSVRKLTTSLMTALAIFAGGQSVQAQNNNYLEPGDPFRMTPDLAWFEPVYDADILDIKPAKRANTGWFATIDKLELYASRPNLEALPNERSERKLDGGSGTRYEFGYMLPDEDHGWLFNATKFEANEFDAFSVLRINVLNDEDLEGDPQFPAPRFGQDALIATDGNNFGFNTRFYNVGRTVNSVDLNSYEIMKTFRMEPYHYGGILEPMVGFRYLRIEDHNGRSFYQRGFEPIDNFSNYYIGTAPAQPLFGVEDPVETYDTFNHETMNDIITGQVGFRYFKYAGRVRYAAEARLFTGMSFQCSTARQTREVTVYDGFDVGDDITLRTYSATNEKIFENDEFTIGFDLRTEMGFQLTKMVQIRGGLQMINVASGVWRGGPLTGGEPGVPGGDQDQDFVAVGGTFGIELNR